MDIKKFLTAIDKTSRKFSVYEKLHHNWRKNLRFVEESTKEWDWTEWGNLIRITLIDGPAESTQGSKSHY